jgi:DnaJ-class molecular chaperone
MRRRAEERRPSLQDRCSNCNGAGKFPTLGEMMWIMCRTCRGSGFRKKEPDMTVVCLECRGDGHFLIPGTTERLECEKCAGIGVLVIN